MSTATGRVETATATSFSATVLDAAGPVVVEFMSYGCAHCRAIEPVVIGVAKALEGVESIVRVNVGIDQELAAGYAVEATPTFVMFREGREVARLAGPRPNYASLLAALTEPFAA